VCNWLVPDYNSLQLLVPDRDSEWSLGIGSEQKMHLVSDSYSGQSSAQVPDS
jgi:hypothetical protein